MKPVNMKMAKALTLIVAAYGTQAMAGQVGTLTTFSAGTTAVAADVNGNFNTVSTAVNDNNTRLTAAEATLTTVEGKATLNEYNIGQLNTKAANNAADIATNSSDITANSTLIADHGNNITSLQSSVTTMLNGNATIVGSSMLTGDEELCHLYRSGPAYFKTSSTSSVCTMTGGIQLPQGVTLGNLSCNIYDNVAGASPIIRLYRVPHDGSATETLFETPAPTSDQLAAVQNVTDTTNAFPGTVDNTQYSYVVSLLSGGVNTATAGLNLRFQSCTVSYGTIF
ncbi:MAG: hypothetical protein OEZ16_11490 [Chromatiales bacterium]|nr:hypothetical protein [Chromatiales bacterium]